MSSADVLINELKSLPCFTQIQSVDLLAHGLSQTAIKVTTASQVFFAKKLNKNTASSEIVSALLCSNVVPASTKKSALAPEVIYHDQEWLITKFIDGITLTDDGFNAAEKTTIALKLMARLHQYTNTIPENALARLNTRHAIDSFLPNLTNSLANFSHTLTKVTHYLNNTIEQLIESSDCQNVICHGDLNFSNILLETSQRVWLVDFECTHYAPREFDLAMFVAVNNISIDNLDHLVTTYRGFRPNVKIHSQLLNHFILYSYFINGLWYLSKKHTSLAREQWAAFDAFALKNTMNLPELLSIVNQ